MKNYLVTFISAICIACAHSSKCEEKNDIVVNNHSVEFVYTTDLCEPFDNSSKQIDYKVSINNDTLSVYHKSQYTYKIIPTDSIAKLNAIIDSINSYAILTAEDDEYDPYARYNNDLFIVIDNRLKLISTNSDCKYIKKKSPEFGNLLQFMHNNSPIEIYDMQNWARIRFLHKDI